MTYWKQIPIEVKPEKPLNYFCKVWSEFHKYHYNQAVYYDGKGWESLKNGDKITHYLVPVTDEEIKKIASEAFSDGYEAAIHHEEFEKAKTDYLNSIK